VDFGNKFYPREFYNGPSASRSGKMLWIKTTLGLFVDLLHNDRVFENADSLDFHLYPVSGFQKDGGYD
jgi:hypothetical protein